jgi:hypothetical protein
MSVVNDQVLVPRPTTFAPSADGLCRLVAALRRAGWIDPSTGHSRESYPGHSDRSRKTLWNLPLGESLSPAWFAARSAQDLHLSWLMTGMDPFARTAAESEAEYSLVLEIAGQGLGYVYRTSDDLDEFADASCSCGADLRFELGPETLTPLDPMRLHERCPTCRRPFDVASRVATYRMPIATRLRGGPAAEASLAGGMSSRVALVIGVGEEVPIDEHHPVPTLREDFIALCTEALGCPWTQIWRENG